MPSDLGRYQLIRTLGTGANAKVKLAQDKDSHKLFAVKIMKKGDPRLTKQVNEMVTSEVQTMSHLNHPNIVNFVEYNQEGKEKKRNGQEVPVQYIVLELASGGELFDFVAMTGKFSEPVARYFFQQLINGLEYVHLRGVTHRDLKPENLLFGEGFNLKIADFGFAAPIGGHDGSGSNKTKLGTESYMAPEIHARRPYIGSSVDLFACGIILFIMVTQHPPFLKAEPQDRFYKLLCANRSDLFWNAHSQNKPGGSAFFSDDIKLLITSLLQFEPSHRPSIAEVKAMSWFNGPAPTHEEINQEFTLRKNNIDQANEAKRRAKEQERQNRTAAGGIAPQRRQYRNVHTAHDESVNRGEEQKILDCKRELEEYMPFMNKNTEFFTNEKPDVVLSDLIAFFKTKGFKFNVANEKYKIKVNQILDEEHELEFCIRILKAEKERLCIEFCRTAGDQLQFFKEFDKMKDELDLEDAEY